MNQSSGFIYIIYKNNNFIGYPVTKDLNSYQKQQIISFSLNKKAHLATITLFEIIYKYGDHIRESWKNVKIIFIYVINIKVIGLYFHSLSI